VPSFDIWWFYAMAGPPNSVVKTAHRIIQMKCWRIRKAHQWHCTLIVFKFIQHLSTKLLSGSTVSQSDELRQVLLWHKRLTFLCRISWFVERGEFSCLLTLRMGWCGINTDICFNDSTYLLDVFGRSWGLVHKILVSLKLLFPIVRGWSWVLNQIIRDTSQ
jgi:hypothetical protein